MHVRAQSGTRIEETARLFDRIEQTVRHTIPPDQLDNIVDNIGLPFSGINMAYQNTGTIGPEDGDALISLKEDHAPTADFIKRAAHQPAAAIPGSYIFVPAGRHRLPNPQFRLAGADRRAGHRSITKRPITLTPRTCSSASALVPGIADLRIQQVFNYPQINVEVDRTFAGEVGLTQRDVANSLLVTLSGSLQVHPNFWLNTENGVSYPIVAQMPQYRIDSMSDLINVPIRSADSEASQYLGGLAQFTPGPSPGVVSHYNVQPVIDIYGAVQGRDLGAVSSDIEHVLQETRKDVPRGSYVVLSGQVHTMTSAYSQLYFGLAGAILLIYLVIVVNFQSWVDPFIIITALPGALAGIVWMLFMTGTTLSVPALTGAIMCMGIATANSILSVSFAREGLAARIGRGISGAGGRLYAFSSGVDDGACDDHRHAADGVCAWRGRRAECAARPRGDRRPLGRNCGDAVLRPNRFHGLAFPAGSARRSFVGRCEFRSARLNASAHGHRRAPIPPGCGIDAAAAAAKPANASRWSLSLPQSSLRYLGFCNDEAMRKKSNNGPRSRRFRLWRLSLRSRAPRSSIWFCPAPFKPGTRRRSLHASAVI